MRSVIYNVPEGTDVGEILVTLYDEKDFEKLPDPGEWTPENRFDVMVRPRNGSVRIWSPPLDGDWTR